MVKEDLIELKLRNIVNSGRPKSIVINGVKHYVSKEKIKNARFEEEKSGGFLPLIPLILGGLAAAGSLAGGAAGITQAVNKKKAEAAALAESQRHNKKLEQIAQGRGIEDEDEYYEDEDDDEEEGEGLELEAISNFVKKVPTTIGRKGKKVLKKTLQHLANAINIEPQGDGLYLNPYGYGNKFIRG